MDLLELVPALLGCECFWLMPIDMLNKVCPQVDSIAYSHATLLLTFRTFL